MREQYIGRGQASGSKNGEGGGSRGGGRVCGVFGGEAVNKGLMEKCTPLWCIVVYPLEMQC